MNCDAHGGIEKGAGDPAMNGTDNIVMILRRIEFYADLAFLHQHELKPTSSHTGAGGTSPRMTMRVYSSPLTLRATSNAGRGSTHRNFRLRSSSIDFSWDYRHMMALDDCYDDARSHHAVAID
jgi:hypothetical protein